MYESFYNLNPTPFRLTPDPHFFFESETHKRGLAFLRYAFYQREGFVAITGAPGTGKTELTLNLIEELPHNKVTLAKIVTTNLDADDLLDLVAESFDIDIKNISKGSELRKMENFFISQARARKQVLLIIDEAHNLSVKSLLELSMLENFQLNEKPIMQCFLLGQLPLEEKLNLPELEPLKQRVIASTRLESLNQQETREYIIHRLSKSGWKNNPVFHDEAFFFIYQYTTGIPRKINSLCNRLLLNSYVEDQHEIDANTVNKVIREIQRETTGESLDLDFADMQTNLNFSSASRRDDDKQPVPTKQNKAQHPAFSNNAKTSKKSRQHEQESSDENIFIPEFLKKNLGERSSDQLNVLDKIREPDTHKSQQNNSGSAPSNHSSSNQNASPIQDNTAVATAQRVTHQHARKSSNLLDKELQFLASLANSNALATVIPANPTADPELKLEPEPAPILDAKPNLKEETLPTEEQKPQQETATIRNIIIDESAYDIDEVIEAFDETNDEKEELEPGTSPVLANHWRETGLAAITVGILVISIGWLNDDNPDPANIVAKNQAELISNNKTPAEAEVFASADPVDVELPVLSTDTSSVETSTVETAKQIVNETQEAETTGTEVLTASATETPSMVEQTLDAESTDPTINSKSGELDTQLTQILEKTGPENIETKNTATASNNQKIETQSKLATLSTEKLRTSPEPDKSIGEKSERQAQGSEKKSVTDTVSVDTGNTASTSQKTNSNSIAMQTSPPNPALLERSIEPPVEPSLNKPAKRVSSDVSPEVPVSTQQSDTKVTSISMLNKSRDSITPPSEPGISNDDLTTLLSRLSAAYETGNLQQLVSTFAPDINSSDGSNRRQMLKEYQRLFNITDKRQLTIQDMKWSTKDRQVLGKGDFEVSIREKGATKYTTYQGKISFAVAKESNSVVIKKLDYDYGQ